MNAEFDLDHIFTHHPPSEQQVEQYARIRGAAKEFAQVVIDNSPRSCRPICSNSLDPRSDAVYESCCCFGWKDFQVMTLGISETDICPKCNANLKDGHSTRLIGIEYPMNNPYRYDGVSEWYCPDCGYREGRWSRKSLQDSELELPPRLQNKQ